MPEFTHLHVHTAYSVLDGLCNIDELVRRTKELGMHALAITDHRNLYGVIDFVQACGKRDIKPIIGIEVEETEDRTIHSRKEMTERGYRNYHLVLLAKNNTGYQNIVEIASDAATTGMFDGKERTDMSILSQYGEGVIALSACLGGRIQQYLLQDRYEEAKEVALAFKETFEEFYLELQHNSLLDQALVNQMLITLSQECDIPLVLTKDVHYILQSDADMHDTILCVQTGKLKSDPDRFRFPGDADYYLASPEEMYTWAKENNIPIEALENTNRIAEKCNVKLDLGNRFMPKFDVPAGFSEATWLRKLCFEALLEYAGKKEIDLMQYIKRLETELAVIYSKGYPGYFLIVQDNIKACQRMGILTGPGRGSAAGCLISFLLGIVKIDPIEHDLLFSRFLNPERNSPPDIDVDHEDERRDEVFEYLRERYGNDNVAQIITFTRLGVKSGIRDIMRVLGYSYATADKVAKLVPNKLPDQSDVTLTKLFQIADDEVVYDKNMNDLKADCQQLKSVLTEKYPDVLKTLERAEGIVRTTGVHAAGVVVTPERVANYVPICKGPAKAILNVTQWDLDMQEPVGTLKLDILSLKYLSIIANTKRSAGITQDLDSLPLDDQAVYKMIRQGYTHGLFQLGGNGITSMATRIKPFEFDDLVDILSLFRPGPLESRMDNGLTMVEQYIQNKFDMDNIEYAHPDLEPILRRSKGVIIYQEQVQQIARKFAGYSLGAADLLRRAMGKKDSLLIRKLRSEFVYGKKVVADVDAPEDEDKWTYVKADVPGCIAMGYSEELGNLLFDMIEKFAQYGFNRSHAASYAQITYQTAWLKHYYPVDYMAALLSSHEIADDIKASVRECRRLGIQILQPDINLSKGSFTVDEVDGQRVIRFGLRSIAGIGDKAIAAIKEARPYKDLADMYERVNRRIVNKRVVDALLKAGCFDFINPNRHALLNQYYQELRGENDSYDETSYGLEQKLEYEKELMGVYISGHPLEKYNLPTDYCSNTPPGAPLEVGCRILKVKEHKDRKNNTMAFLTIETIQEEYDAVVFSRQYKSNKKKLKAGEVVILKGRKDSRRESMIVNQVSRPTTTKTTKTPSVKKGDVPCRPNPLHELISTGISN